MEVNVARLTKLPQNYSYDLKAHLTESIVQLTHPCQETSVVNIHRNRTQTSTRDEYVCVKHCSHCLIIRFSYPWQFSSMDMGVSANRPLRFSLPCNIVLVVEWIIWKKLLIPQKNNYFLSNHCDYLPTWSPRYKMSVEITSAIKWRTFYIGQACVKNKLLMRNVLGHTKPSPLRDHSYPELKPVKRICFRHKLGAHI